MFNFRNAVFAAILLAGWGGATAASLPTVCAGYTVKVYASVPEPMKLSFAPDGTLYVGRQGFADIDDMKFDHAGRLIFSDDNPQVLASSGNPPTVLFTLPSRPGSIAIDEDDRIYVALADGTIRIHTPDGTLADAAFASGLARLDTYLAFGPGAGGFGKALYVLNGSELLRFDRNGMSHRIGSGFDVGPSSGTGFVFGPDGALYVSDYNRNRILRIARGFTAGHQSSCPPR